MKMKRFIALMLALLTLFALTACGGATNDDAADTGDAADDVLKIGIVQLVKHDALDAAYEGFVDALAAAGYSEEIGNIKINYQVATGKPDECATIAQQLVSEKSDLILAIATPAAQAAVNATSSIPILVTAVTNPEGDCPGANVSGTSDLGPIADQIAFAKKLNPELKTIGILYNSSEANSKFQAGMAIEAAKANDIAYKEFTVTAATELQSVVESMKGQVEVCWLPTDNTCASNMPIISSASVSAGVMTVCSEAGMVDNGGLCTYGAVDYFTLGQQTGEMAVKLLSGEAAVSDLEIGFQSAGDEAAIVINEDVAANFEIPAEILEKATLVKTAVAE